MFITNIHGLESTALHNSITLEVEFLFWTRHTFTLYRTGLFTILKSWPSRQTPCISIMVSCFMLQCCIHVYGPRWPILTQMWSASDKLTCNL